MSADGGHGPVRLWTGRVLLIGLGTAVVPLDSAVNIAFPDITASFGLEVQSIQWVVICYVLTHAGLMLAFGRIGDMLGHAAVFRLGLLCSAAAFLLCAAAPSYGWLLAFRVVQGVGAALVLSCGPALVTGLFPEAQRSRVLGIYTMLFAVGSALGPSLGGVLVQLWGWSAVYWFRAPIALLALLLLRGLPAAPRPATREPFDMVGAGLLALTLAAMLLALTQLQRVGQQEYGPLLLAALALAALVGFVRHEARFPRPIVEIGLFRRPGFALVNAANVLTNLASFAVMLLAPYYLVRMTGLPLLVCGLLLAAGPVGTMAASPLAGWVIGRLPPQRVALLGAALASAGLFAVTGWDAETGVAAIVLPLFLQGFGLGLFQVAYMDIVTGTIARHDRGVAGSLAMVTRTLGIVAGATLLALSFQSIEAAALADGSDPAESFLAGFRATFLLAAMLPAAMAAAMALGRGTRKAARAGGRPGEG